MVIIVRFKIVLIVVLILAVLIGSSLGIYLRHLSHQDSIVLIDEDLERKLIIKVKEIFDFRNASLLLKNEKMLEEVYDLEMKYSQWAFEHELKKMKHLHQWSKKQGITFAHVASEVVIRSAKEENNGYALNLLVSTEYQYVYVDAPDDYNSFRLGTYHSLNIIPHEKGWVIAREWYTDPFADSLELDEIKSEELQQIILYSEAKDLSNLDERRKNVVAYADQYSGAANLPEYGLQYNPNYRDYNNEGGNCANFTSQALYEGGNFKKNTTWNYERGAGSKSWLNASAFNQYMLNSGRGSRIAYGSYEQVLQDSFNLLPGDYIAYEKKGKVTHISLVTGIDSKGYALVNSNNADRHRTPWDLGWSNKGIKFHLVRVNY
ncbi:MAG: amidase domain-containing protein [Clostridiaceae bacterium]|nr:amidase domain-containing protein [Clostridiaceae bacterium]